MKSVHLPLILTVKSTAINAPDTTQIYHHLEEMWDKTLTSAAKRGLQASKLNNEKKRGNISFLKRSDDPCK